MTLPPFRHTCANFADKLRDIARQTIFAVEQVTFVLLNLGLYFRPPLRRPWPITPEEVPMNVHGAFPCAVSVRGFRYLVDSHDLPLSKTSPANAGHRNILTVNLLAS